MATLTHPSKSVERAASVARDRRTTAAVPWPAVVETVEIPPGSEALSPSAIENTLSWLTEPRYAEYASQVADHIARGDWRTLNDVFWTVLPFGTGGRRGRMYPIGTNAINERTMAESAAGLAVYVRDQRPGAAQLSCAIGYDTRHGSRAFAELCAEVMVAAGFHVYFLDGFRGTPALSVAVRHLNCDCGLMITASHNPPTDNAVKVYWTGGGQLLPPHDQGVIERVMRVRDIDRVPFAVALDDGRIECRQDAIDAVYQRGVLAAGFRGPRDLRILYSPMHGVGASSVVPVLAAAGFRNVQLYAPHAEPDGDFPNVPGHVANPENPVTFEGIIRQAAEEDFDVAFSTDPDADRLGCAAPLTPGGPWQTLTGNQIGALLTDYVLNARRPAGTLTPDHFVAATMVTTPLIRRIAESYGVCVRDDLPVGFKWIAAAIDEWGADRFVLGVEESHGYLAGDHARDKDAAVAALLLAELAAREKAAGRTLHQALTALHARHGCHAERTIARTMPGAEGMARMAELLKRFRDDPPRSLAGMEVTHVRDYARRVIVSADGTTSSLTGPPADLLILELAGEGNRVAIRPSGTEPKMKLYLFAYEPPGQAEDLKATRALLDRRLDELERDLAVVSFATDSVESSYMSSSGDACRGPATVV